MGIRKKTEILRATTGNVATVVLPREDAPSGSIRRVTIVTPASPSIAIALDQEPEAIADGRVFEWRPLPTGTAIPPFDLLPEQFISAAVEGVGLAHFSIIVQYLEPEG
jgi:hypothetical protein